jgi:hypothetical protein
MKIFVIYDEKGQIKGTVVPTHDQVRIHSSEGTRVHTIEHPETDHKAGQRYVRDLHENFRVEVLGEPRLVRKRA